MDIFLYIRSYTLTEHSSRASLRFCKIAQRMNYTEEDMKSDVSLSIKLAMNFQSGEE